MPAIVRLASASLVAVLLLLVAPLAVAQNEMAPAAGPGAVQPFDHVEAQYVCMVNDQVFPKKQIEVVVDDKMYYGCCAMCKDRLAKDEAARKSLDPVSGKEVDKATAYILVKDAELNVLYFENEANAKTYIAQNKKV